MDSGAAKGYVLGFFESFADFGNSFEKRLPKILIYEIFTLRNTVDLTVGEHKELTLDFQFKIPGETTKPGRFI